MFSALNQGSYIHILDATDGIKYKVGEIVGTSIPQFATDGSNQMVMNLKIKIGEHTDNYNNIPANASSVTYNNGKLLLSETKAGIQSEIETRLRKADYILTHIDDYKTEKQECEEALKELSPQYAKDKERDEDIAGLKREVSSMKDDIEKILHAVTNPINK